eukprot:CAMPEP_0119323504 /NCGR_PEP_ID=MMETSP1333-20130426/60873_1 /TAXON_ID=418940 /ORGANISM="Scyphosphaera apsteinii, Strain RCC1455" /LENGTH=175 /DNA_ID=CAMNT_0007330971 /DNA_START=168 /DNA_END=695 /DNA_ORIENTATION=+
MSLCGLKSAEQGEQGSFIVACGLFSDQMRGTAFLVLDGERFFGVWVSEQLFEKPELSFAGSVVKRAHTLLVDHRYICTGGDEHLANFCTLVRHGHGCANKWRVAFPVRNVKLDFVMRDEELDALEAASGGIHGIMERRCLDHILLVECGGILHHCSLQHLHITLFGSIMSFRRPV